MNQNIYDTINLRCTVLSPLHIGTGLEVPDYEYVIKNGLFIKLNLNSVFASLNPEELDQINKLNDMGDYIGVRKFFQKLSENIAWLNQNVKFTLPVSTDVEEKLTSPDRDILNQGLIRLNYRNELNNNVVLPGSSLKGALRTSVIDKLSKVYEKKLDRNSQIAEGQLLNALNQKSRFSVVADPFKYLKVPDIDIGSNVSRIAFVRNVAKSGDKLKENQIQMVHEVSRSLIDEFHLTFDVRFELAKGQSTRTRLNKSDLIMACKDYYWDKLVNVEMPFFEDTAVYDNLLKIKNEISNDEFLIRVGRFSGKESITLDKKHWSDKKEPKTRNLADGKYPMGWIKCKIVN